MPLENSIQTTNMKYEHEVHILPLPYSEEIEPQNYVNKDPYPKPLCIAYSACAILCIIGALILLLLASY